MKYFSEELLGFLIPLFLVALIFIIVLFSIFTGIYFLDKAACSRKAVSFEDHSYSLLGGCMVKHEDKWLPLDNIRGFD